MIKFLIKSTNEVRVETMDDVNNLHKELQKQAADGHYTLSSFSWSEKTKKAQGEIVELWYVVKYAFTFTDQKDPEELFNVGYEKIDSSNAQDKEGMPW